MFRPLACAVLAISLLACTTTPTQPKPSTSPKPVSTSGLATAAKVALTGSILSAAGIVAQGAGNIVAQGAGNLTGAAGGNIVAQGAGNFTGMGRHLFEITQNPLANAEVFLANPDGTQVKGTKTALSDAKGAFSLPDVPVGATVIVATHVKTKDGKDALMETLAVPSKDAAVAGMDTATTLVARAVVGTSAAKPGLVDVANWVETVELCKRQLNPGKWPDLADQKGIDDWMTGLEKDVPGMDEHVKKLVTNLKGS
ncbi:MAG: hypothetical protein JWM80_5429 [Cyanobacteria bacterium RYN_339]|nr:hypothetical protein [Cyanobacteria bacterium RYN_339]